LVLRSVFLIWIEPLNWWKKVLTFWSSTALMGILRNVIETGAGDQAVSS
jgi:hypothetical protein